MNQRDNEVGRAVAALALFAVGHAIESRRNDSEAKRTSRRSIRPLLSSRTLALNEGKWGDEQLISRDYLEASFAPAYGTDEWPADYDSPLLTSYGYQWWLIGDEAIVARGKNGQYLYVHPSHNVVIVRLGKSHGGIGWVDLLHQIGTSAPTR